MHWFKRWLSCSKTIKITQSDVFLSLDALNQSISETDSGIQKGLRRLSLVQKQQNETMVTLANELTSLKCAIADRHGIVLTYQHILHLLDQLAKISLAAHHKEIMMSLIDRTTTDLLSFCELEAIATISEPYPARGCEVVGAVEAPQSEPGTVHEIVQQGYQTPDDQVVRVAKVIVCRETKVTQDEETNHVH